MKINYKQVGRRISIRRRQLNIKQCELAKKISMTNNHISNIENGHTIPSLETFIKICEALDVTPDYFLLGAIKTDLNKNITDKLLMCPEETLKVVDGILDVLLASVVLDEIKVSTN